MTKHPYARYVEGLDPLRTLELPTAADRVTLKRYAAAYKGPQQGLVVRYLQSLSLQ